MSDIFICYSRSDLSIAEQLVQRFQQEGWDVFIDKQTHVGRRWHKEIERELHNTRAIVVLWSAASRDSDFVLEEAEYGKRQNILFPAFIERVEFPYGFSRIQTVDLSNWKNNPAHPDWVALLQSLRAHLNGRERIPVTLGPAEAAQLSVTPPISIPKPEDGTSGSSKTDSEESTMRKFLLPAALVLLGIIIFTLTESINENFTQTSPTSTSEPKNVSTEVVEEKVFPIKQEVIASQNRPITLLDRKFLPELIQIRDGTFNMGEQDQAFIAFIKEVNVPKELYGVPGKKIQISTPFYLGKSEITYEQYDYYIHHQQIKGIQIVSPNSAAGGRGNQPVVNIDWNQAMAYARWLGEKTNNQCRLPTEAEWEYAARAGMHTAYPWGDEVGRNNANCSDCGSRWDSEQSAPVESFAPNQFGLYDMSGNVWEWTCSNWRNQFDGSEQQCNDDTTDTSFRVVRGGSWFAGTFRVRSSARNFKHPGARDDIIGFRVLCASLIDE